MDTMNQVPTKPYFKVNEVCALTGVKSYVLRFWETEFPELSPTTDDEGNKVYQRSDVESILKIKHLLYTDKLPIDRAKLMFSEKESKSSAPLTTEDNIAKAKAKLRELMGLADSINQKYHIN